MKYADVSTTKLLTTEKPDLVEKEGLTSASKLYLPQNPSRKVEGGLRTKNLFKTSYPNKPLISIVTVVFNGEKHLEQAIQSVLHQTYDNVEYIIIDGGSTDGTLDIIKKYDDAIDYWVSEPDHGIYDAMNKGASLSSGDYTAFLNADDWYTKNAFSLIIEALQVHRFEFIFGDTNQFENEELQNTIIADLGFYTLNTPIGHQALFVKTKYLLLYPFDLKFPVYADYDFMIKLIRLNIQSYHIKEPIVNYRLGGFSSTGNILKERFLVHLKYFGLRHAVYNYIMSSQNILLNTIARIILRIKKYINWDKI